MTGSRNPMEEAKTVMQEALADMYGDAPDQFDGEAKVAVEALRDAGLLASRGADEVPALTDLSLDAERRATEGRIQALHREIDRLRASEVPAGLTRENELREALKSVSNAYGCFAGCPAGALKAGFPEHPGADNHTPGCAAARAALRDSGDGQVTP